MQCTKLHLRKILTSYRIKIETESFGSFSWDFATDRDLSFQKLENIMTTSYNLNAGVKTTARMPQYIAGLAAAGGAFAMGTALGKKKT